MGLLDWYEEKKRFRQLMSKPAGESIELDRPKSGSATNEKLATNLSTLNAELDQANQTVMMIADQIAEQDLRLEIEDIDELEYQKRIGPLLLRQQQLNESIIHLENDIKKFSAEPPGSKTPEVELSDAPNEGIEIQKKLTDEIEKLKLKLLKTSEDHTAALSLLQDQHLYDLKAINEKHSKQQNEIREKLNKGSQKESQPKSDLEEKLKAANAEKERIRKESENVISQITNQHNVKTENLRAEYEQSLQEQKSRLITENENEKLVSGQLKAEVEKLDQNLQKAAAERIESISMAHVEYELKLESHQEENNSRVKELLSRLEEETEKRKKVEFEIEVELKKAAEANDEFKKYQKEEISQLSTQYEEKITSLENERNQEQEKLNLMLEELDERAREVKAGLLEEILRLKLEMETLQLDQEKALIEATENSDREKDKLRQEHIDYIEALKSNLEKEIVAKSEAETNLQVELDSAQKANRELNEKLEAVYLEQEGIIADLQAIHNEKLNEAQSQLENEIIRREEMETELREQVDRLNLEIKQQITEPEEGLPPTDESYDKMLEQLSEKHEKLMADSLLHEDKEAELNRELFGEEVLSGQKIKSQAETDGYNLRKAKRYPVQIECILENPESIQLKEIQNVSEGGCFINLSKALQPNTPIRFRLLSDTSTGLDEILINGKVTFSMDMESAGIIGVDSGVGVELIDFPTEEDKRKYVELIGDIEETG